MKLLSEFRIAETKEFKNILQSTDLISFYDRLKKVVYPQLRTNPFFGPNIKKLKGKLDGLYRYRIGDYRLFYKIDKDTIIVFIVTLKHRKNSY